MGIAEDKRGNGAGGNEAEAELPSGQTAEGDSEASRVAQYTPSEHQDIWQELGGGKAPQCPRCRVAMHPRTIGGGSFGLGYARQRVWLLCPRCHRSAIFDTARGTRN
jgi:hypothetical protein